MSALGSPKVEKRRRKTIEQVLHPPLLARPLSRDILTIGLLLGMLVVLLPAAKIDVTGLVSGEVSEFQYVFRSVLGPMASVYLLMGLGFLLCLRAGAIDLSIWALSALGGFIAATLINAGMNPVVAIISGSIAGAGIGLAQGLLTTFARLPSPVITLTVAVLIVIAMNAFSHEREIPLKSDVFDTWHMTVQIDHLPEDDDQAEGPKVPVRIEHAQPLYITRMFVVIVIYSVVLGAMMLGEMISPGWALGYRRLLLVLAMSVSGALSASAGALWLIDHGSSPLATRPVDNMLPVAAAIVSGGLFLGGRGRSLLSGVLLPGALLVTTLWQMSVWNFQRWGYALQTLVLVAMTLVAYWAGAKHSAGARMGSRRLFIGACMCIAGIVVFGSSASADVAKATTLELIGIAVWLIGALGAVLPVRFSRISEK